jgi:hypothetical protein
MVGVCQRLLNLTIPSKTGRKILPRGTGWELAAQPVHWSLRELARDGIIQRDRDLVRQKLIGTENPLSGGVQRASGQEGVTRHDAGIRDVAVSAIDRQLQLYL